MRDAMKGMAQGALFAAFALSIMGASAWGMFSVLNWLMPIHKTSAPSQLDRIEAKLDALQSTADQTVDFLSDLHAERAKPQ